jgi:osmotically inducible protein OsmC
MSIMQRRATAVWQGDLSGGGGTVGAASGAFSDLAVSWRARTEHAGGDTSPEELIAAAHASCYAMAFSNVLAGGGNAPERLEVTATCHLDRAGAGVRISIVELAVRGRVAGLDAGAFERAAAEADSGCPVSNAVRGNVEIRVQARLED